MTLETDLTYSGTARSTFLCPFYFTHPIVSDFYTHLLGTLPYLQMRIGFRHVLPSIL